MKYIKILKAIREFKELNKMINKGKLPDTITIESDEVIRFKYKSIEGKILIIKGEYELYTLFDVYDNDKLVKVAHHYKLRKNTDNQETFEMSRSGNITPGPC